MLALAHGSERNPRGKPAFPTYLQVQAKYGTYIAAVIYRMNTDSKSAYFDTLAANRDPFHNNPRSGVSIGRKVEDEHQISRGLL